MTPERTLEAFDACDAAILEFSRLLSDSPEPPAAERNQRAVKVRDRLSHARWMIAEGKGFVSQGRMEKAFRWLGFVQGVMWSLHISPIEELKRMNMPREAAADT